MPLLQNSLTFLPNNKLKIINNNSKSIRTFDIQTDQYNQLYFYDEKNDSRLFYKNDGSLFCFERFEGSKKSLLFEFYTSCYSILLGYYPKIEMVNNFPNYHFAPFGLKTLNDMVAPLFNMLTIKHFSKAVKIDNIIEPNELLLETKLQMNFFKTRFYENKYTVKIDSKNNIAIHNSKTNIHYTILCEPYSL
jgi:hypothetical protein